MTIRTIVEKNFTDKRRKSIAPQTNIGEYELRSCVAENGTFCIQTLRGGQGKPQGRLSTSA